MLYLSIIIFLFLVVVTYLALRSLASELGVGAGIKVEGSDHTKSNSIQVKSDLFNRLCKYHREGLISKDKLIFTRGLHTVERSSVNPWFLTGLVDAEGSFVVHIVKDDSRKLGCFVLASFELALNVKDRLLLDLLQETMGNIGNIYYNPQDDTYKYKVSNIEGLNNFVIPHFQKYPLLTQKKVDFEIFVKIIQIMYKKEHLTAKGLQEIINLKSSLNLGLSIGLSKKLSDSFKVEPVERPKFTPTFISDPSWLAGFCEGESCFYINIGKSPKSKTGWAVQLVFKITQHSRDIQLLELIKNFLDCGRIEKRAGFAADFTVTSIKDIDSKILTFFNKYPLQGSKLLNLNDFKEAFIIMESKGHLTEEGLNKIRAIKAGMNTGRI
jgi:hypothetical protein